MLLAFPPLCNSVFLEGFILSRDFIGSYMIMTQIFIAALLVLPPNSRSGIQLHSKTLHWSL